MGKRRVKRSNRKPTFFWQGVLILAPLVVLAKIGAVALLQDQRMARHEAELRAQDIAEEAAEKIWNELQSFPTNEVVAWEDGGAGRARWSTWVKQLDSDDPALRIELDPANKLLRPPSYDLVPMPQPLEGGQLTETQRVLW